MGAVGSLSRDPIPDPWVRHGHFSSADHRTCKEPIRQMVPETRSAEFFGFFGFFGKVAALIGPLLYGFMTVTFDSRVGILAVSMLILAGALMMRLVDVDKGRGRRTRISEQILDPMINSGEPLENYCELHQYDDWPPTRNIDSGSGGDKKAPAARAENQSNDLLSVISSDVRKPARIIMNANSGTWKPTADAVKSPRINPSQEPTCGRIDASRRGVFDQILQQEGIRTLFAYVSPSTPNPMDEVVTIASFNGVLFTNRRSLGPRYHPAPIER